MGNVGAHYDPANDVTKDEAEALQHLTRQLLTYVYEMPAHIQRSRSPQPAADDPSGTG